MLKVVVVVVEEDFVVVAVAAAERMMNVGALQGRGDNPHNKKE